MPDEQRPKVSHGSHGQGKLKAFEGAPSHHLTANFALNAIDICRNGRCPAICGFDRHSPLTISFPQKSTAGGVSDPRANAINEVAHFFGWQFF